MRRLSTIVGMGLMLVSPPLRAQSPSPAAFGACVTCHGPDFEAAPLPQGSPPIPRVGGQHAEYIAKQLREYKAGKRKNDVMTAMTAKLPDRQLRELAAHLASLAPARPAAENSPLVERGRALYDQGNASVPACVGCHLSGALGAPRYPRLAGQRQAYIAQQLKNFKQGVRTNDRARVMRNIAANLSDEDIAALAEYLSQLSGM
ncbi:MAG TPA: c-type cytochrome [Vicinamibacterales bacterium]|nr:c-type cytochrome [Vicinamibacterales bacterium]